MTVFILILAAVFFIGLAVGAAAWFILRRRQGVEGKEPDQEPTARETLSFRWRYIIAPIAILLLSIIISALFYPRLPTEVGYHFTSDETPDRWLSREMAIVMTLAPQLLLALLAGGIAMGIAKLGLLSSQSEVIGIKPQRLLFLMSNIIVLPQVIFGFAMLDVFSYNAFQIHIMPTWVFLLILALSTIALGVLFIVIVLRARKQQIHQPEE